MIQKKPFKVQVREPFSHSDYIDEPDKKEKLAISIESMLEESWDDILNECVTPWDLANDIAVLVLK